MFEKGTIVTISGSDRLRGKPRPAVVVQASEFDFPDTLLVVPLTSRDVDDNFVTPRIIPDGANGLNEPSSAMIQRMGAIHKAAIGNRIGSLSDLDMERIYIAMRFILGMVPGDATAALGIMSRPGGEISRA
jgi:mRNA interferase MazF